MIAIRVCMIPLIFLLAGCIATAGAVMTVGGALITAGEKAVAVGKALKQ